MRNLKAINYEQWKTAEKYQGRQLSAATWDLANDALLCCYGPSETDAVVNLLRVNTKTQYDIGY